MALPQYPLVNGFRHSWASVEAKIQNIPFRGIQEVNYTTKQEGEKLWGPHPEALGETLGELDHEGSIVLPTREFYHLLGMLGPGFMKVRFPIVVSYAEEEDGGEVITDELLFCRLRNLDASNARGAGALMRKVDLSIMKIKWNGVEAFDPPLAIAGV